MTWPTRRVSSLATYRNGFPFKPDDVAVTGRPIIRIRQLLDPEVAPDRFDGVVPPTVEVDTGDLIFSWSATLACRRWDRGPAVLNQHLFRVDPEPGVHPGWLYWALTWSVPHFAPFMHGSAMTHVTRPMMKAVTVPFPPLETQREIAEFLDRECARVAALQTSVGALSARAGNAYLSASRDAIVHGGFPLVQIKLVARPGTGHTPSRTNPDYWMADEQVIPWFGLVDVWQIRDDASDIVTETAERITLLGLANSAAVLHPAGTVIFSRTASVGFVGRMGVDMAVTQDFMTWTCGPLLEPEYLLHALRAMRPEILQRVQGSTHKTIYMPDLLGLKVPLPPVEQQREIVDGLNAALEARRRLLPVQQALRARLDIYRDSLIHEAVTGKLDVSRASERHMEERLHAASEGRLDEVAVP